MTEKEQNKLVKRMDKLITLLTNDDSYYLDLLDEFQTISHKLNFEKVEEK